MSTSSATAVLSVDRLRDLLKLDQDEGTDVIIVETGNGPAGYVHVDVAAGGGAAWIVSGAVDPSQRRRGIGTALLTAAAEAARRRGVDTVQISGRPYGYAAPGVDVEADPGAAAFLEAQGARPLGRALSMHRTLHDLGSGSGKSATAVRTCTLEDLGSLLSMVSEHLDQEWTETLSRYVEGGGILGRILLAHASSGELLGFACWGVVGRDPARFGPFGVAPVSRGHGAGGALLDAALHRMAGEGLAHAWFQWTGPGSPAHRLYTSRGFTPLRTFTPYALPTGHVDVTRSQEGITR
ncbi:GNAT family N-acetyltransferase [Brachybacterium tyrofermentans]|uniref:GNAT family N-acetyltransferase n=1 Tax=Brachybacterium tyrofermentans TaxID=47848 RepID=A0ABW0FC89_9MICO